MTWKNYSRTCARCGNVGPRVSNPTGPGWIHAYCRTEEEKRAERQRLTEQARQLAARIAAHKAGVAEGRHQTPSDQSPMRAPSAIQSHLKGQP
jgi:hypothetical protein